MTLAVLSVAAEAVPLVKTGGLGDVVGALPGAVAPHGVAMTTLLPGYPAVLAALSPASKPMFAWEALLSEPAVLRAGEVAGHRLLVLDCPGLFARAGGPYADDKNDDWPDNWRRFAALGRAAADIAGGGVPQSREKGLAFDILHAHDWQAGLALAYQRFAPPMPAETRRAIPSVMTIHNIAFQGRFGAEVFPRLGLPAEAWSINGVEYHGGVGYLKAGLEAADVITTVSPGYAREIRSARFGMGLEGLIVSRGARVRGLLNGIDTTLWNPATDPALAARFTRARFVRARAANKRALEAELGLERGAGPLFIVISRLTWQKGMDVLARVIDHLVGLGGRLAVLGSGEAAIGEDLLAAAARHKGRVAVRIGYDEGLSHRMQAGGDAILVPSRFEPCGLTQLYALAYGCVPVVARTGGLADSVIDANPAALAMGVATGIQFAPMPADPVPRALPVSEEVDALADALAEAITRADRLFRQPAVWRQLQKNGMAADFGWARCGGAYAALYRELAGERVAA